MDCRTPGDIGIVFVAYPFTLILPLISLSNVKNSDNEICFASCVGFPFLNVILLVNVF